MLVTLTNLSCDQTGVTNHFLIFSVQMSLNIIHLSCDLLCQIIKHYVSKMPVTKVNTVPQNLIIQIT